MNRNMVVITHQRGAWGGIWGVVSLSGLEYGDNGADSGGWDNNLVLSFLTVVSSLCSWWLLWFGRSNKVVGPPGAER